MASTTSIYSNYDLVVETMYYAGRAWLTHLTIVELRALRELCDEDDFVRSVVGDELERREADALSS